MSTKTAQNLKFSATTSRPLIWPTDSLMETWDYCKHSRANVGQISYVEVLLPPRDHARCEGFRTVKYKALHFAPLFCQNDLSECQMCPFGGHKGTTIT